MTTAAAAVTAFGLFCLSGVQCTHWRDRVEARLTQLEAEQRNLKMENSELQAENDNLTDLVHKLQTGSDGNTKRVAFLAMMPSSPNSIQLSNGQRLVLVDVKYNQGGGYNNTTGAFTAPYSGTYAFSVNAVTYYKGDNSKFQIMLNGRLLSRSNTHDPSKGQSLNVVLHLYAGQQVWVESYLTGYYYREGTVFSGFLVSSDP